LKKVVAFGITVGAGLVGLLGYNAYREIQALKGLDLEPGTFRIHEIAGSLVRCSIQISFFNPSNTTVTLRSLQAMAFYKSNVLAKLSTITFTLFSKKEIPVLVPFEVESKKLLEVAAAIVTGGESKVRFNGRVILQLWGMKVPVPFDFMVDVREQLMNYFNTPK
jgi:hypothetical protein